MERGRVLCEDEMFVSISLLEGENKCYLNGMVFVFCYFLRGMSAFGSFLELVVISVEQYHKTRIKRNVDDNRYQNVPSLILK